MNHMRNQIRNQMRHKKIKIQTNINAMSVIENFETLKGFKSHLRSKHPVTLEDVEDDVYPIRYE
jgi:hypothetical protein